MSLLKDIPKAETAKGPAGSLSPRKAGKISPWQKRYHRQGWLYIAPALALFALMIAYPIIRSFYLSFFDYTLLEPDSSKFVGMGNYAKLFTQTQNQLPFWNTLYFTAIFIPPYLVLALGLAMMLNACRRGTVILRTLIFAPVVVSLAVSSVMWILFYNPAFGMAQQMLMGACAAINHPWHLSLSFAVAIAAMLLIVLAVNQVGRLLRPAAPEGNKGPGLRLLIPMSIILGVMMTVSLWTFASSVALDATSSVLGAAGLAPGGVSVAAAPSLGVLGDSRWAMIAIAIMCIWNGVGINIILFLVGLQRIPDELYEAGMVDGAGSWRRFWNITLPQLRPTIYLVVLLSLIGSFKIFGQPLIMTDGGPQDSTLTFVMRIYKLAFKYGKLELGYASALSYALAVFILFMTLLVKRLNKPVE